MSKRKGGGQLIFWVIAGVLAYSWFGDIFEWSSTKAPTSPVAITKPAPVATQIPYARTFSGASWPPVEDGISTLATGEWQTANYYVIMDGSGSMESEGCSNGRPKIDLAKEVVAGFADQVPTDANLGLAVFDRIGIQEMLPLVKNRAAFKEEIANIVTGSSTPLRAAITLGLKVLTEQAKKQLGYGQYHLVIVTDGAASDGQNPRAIVNDILRETPVVIHTIGFCISGNHSLKQEGQLDYKAANSPEDLRKGLEAVLAESPEFVVADF